MRIISKEHDYYDSVQAYGHDSSLIYLRKEEEIVPTRISVWDDINEILSDLDRYITIYWSRHDKKELAIDVYVIGFCGKIYPLIRISGIDFLYNIEDTNKCLSEKHPKHYQSFVDDSIGSWRRKSKAQTKQKRLEALFKCSGSDKFMNIFIESNAPIFLCHRNEDRDTAFYLNPSNLKNYKFQKIFDPFAAFQELEMFMGSLKSNEPDVASIEDKYRISAHGFDKWSFRKMPGKRKPRKAHK